MNRSLVPFGVLTILCCICFAQSAVGQNRIADLFAEKNHDFGVVPRAAKSEHVFEFTNTTDQAISFSGASRSCGCITPKIETMTVQPGEKGKIRATFNTRSFTGDRRATITLNVSRPYFTQVQLHIKGYVRTDVVVQPNFADFNNVVAGADNERNITLNYAGSSIWKIVEIRSDNPNIKTEATEVSRNGGRIQYNLKVTLDQGQPWGFMNEQIILVTNDNRKKELPIMVSGNIKAPIEVPAMLNLGNISQGTTVTKTLMVKAANAFTVTGIEGDNPRITFQTPEEKNKFHMVKIEVDTTEVGSLEDTITITTDVPAMPTAKVKLTGKIVGN